MKNSADGHPPGRSPGLPGSAPAADRRTFLQRAGIGLLAFKVGGATCLLTPAAARAAAADFESLSPAGVVILEALGDTLLPGAAANGIAHFVDRHLSVDPQDCLLLIRYLDVSPPYTAFYRAGLAALDGLAHGRHGRGFADIDPSQREELVTAMADGITSGWTGPPAALFYFLARSDAIDVVYGTMTGFGKLGIPYMAHIAPAARW